MKNIKGINVFGDPRTPEIAKALAQFVEFLDQSDEITQAAMMPDAHFGYAVPIGGIFASKTKVYPTAVGYDIGCGMCAVKTTFNIEKVRGKRDEIFNQIYRDIPTGYNRNKSATKSKVITKALKGATQTLHGIFDQYNGFHQLGSLGSGNHFIEIGNDEEDNVWIVIHSGSRGIGHKTATHYMDLAYNGLGKKEGNHPLKVDSNEGQDYIKDLNFCLDFALENRKEMISRVIAILDRQTDSKVKLKDCEMFINRNHNHAELKGDLWIHRKGATHAEEGMLGVIPANMRDGSFIVRGKGSADSLFSSSHGAGRVYGRREAKRVLNIEDFHHQMEGITAKVCENTIDESPSAYKDIKQVMKDQEDLVDVLHHIKPIINIKA